MTTISDARGFFCVRAVGDTDTFLMCDGSHHIVYRQVSHDREYDRHGDPVACDGSCAMHDCKQEIDALVENIESAAREMPFEFICSEEVTALLQSEGGIIGRLIEANGVTQFTWLLESGMFLKMMMTNPSTGEMLLRSSEHSLVLNSLAAVSESVAMTHRIRHYKILSGHLPHTLEFQALHAIFVEVLRDSKLSPVVAHRFCSREAVIQERLRDLLAEISGEPRSHFAIRREPSIGFCGIPELEHALGRRLSEGEISRIPDPTEWYMAKRHSFRNQQFRTFLLPARLYQSEIGERGACTVALTQGGGEIQEFVWVMVSSAQFLKDAAAVEEGQVVFGVEIVGACLVMDAVKPQHILPYDLFGDQRTIWWTGTDDVAMATFQATHPHDRERVVRTVASTFHSDRGTYCCGHILKQE